VKGKTGSVAALGGLLKSKSGRMVCSCSDRFGGALQLRLGGRGTRQRTGAEKAWS
jgi:hypothetical protein